MSLQTHHRRHGIARLGVCLIIAGCSSTSTSTAPPTAPPTSTGAAPTFPKPLQLIVDHRKAPTDDTIEVFVCDVPVPTTDPLYGDLPLRLALSPQAIAEQLQGVSAYFMSISHGLYAPMFTAGSTLVMATDETHDHCVDRALDASAATAATALVVASAEDLSTRPGGWGKPGSPCPTDFCPASVTRRSVYVGASDFYGAESGGRPLLDLIEHEIGHTLDLPHSGDVGDEHASALDLMSNSAAPRDVQPERVDAPDTIAIDRVALGWLPTAALAVAESGAKSTSGTFGLRPSTGTAGLRLLVLPVDDTKFVTVEFLPTTGYDDHLPAAGIAVHLVDQSPEACGRAASAALCVGIDRKQIVLGSTAPHLQLLHLAESAMTVQGWTIRLVANITSTTDQAQVEVTPTDG